MRQHNLVTDLADQTGALNGEMKKEREELDKVCRTMERTITRQKSTMLNRVKVRVVPSIGYVTGNRQSPAWQIQAGGQCNIHPPMQAIYRAVVEDKSGETVPFPRVKTYEKL